MQRLFNSFVLTSLEESETVILFDFSNLAFCSLFAKAYSHLKTIHGTPTGHVFGAFQKIISIANQLGEGNTSLVFALDSKGGTEKKRKLVEGYKVRDSELEFDPRPDLKKVLKKCLCSYVSCKKEEADDVVATFCKKYKDKKITIVSTDKDFYQLLGMKNVTMHNLVKREFVYKEDREKTFGVNSWKKVVLHKALFGDSSDCIVTSAPNVNRGMVIPIINKSDGTVPSFYEELEKAERGKGKLSELAYSKILSNRDIVKNKYKIIKLKRKLDMKEEHFPGDIKNLVSLFIKYECNSLRSDAKFLVGK